MPATLYIWSNNPGPRAAVTPGHAALEVVHGANREYISWWPTGDSKAKPFKARPATAKTFGQDAYEEMGAGTRKKLQEGAYPPRWGQFRMNVPTHAGLEKMWVQGPHHRLEIPGAGETATGIGLNIQRIIDWWNVFSRAQNSEYRFVSKTMNCASIVGTALIAGGGNLFALEDIGEMSSGWHTPMDVLAYGNNIHRGIERISVYVAEVRQSRPEFGIAAMPTATKEREKEKMAPVNWEAERTVSALGHPDLMTYATWVALSDRHVKRFLGIARRKDQVAKIDRLLQDYHTTPWNLNDVPSWDVKVRKLHEMLKQVHEHMREKANSDRAEAVFVLGKQLVDVIDRYGDMGTPSAAAVDRSANERKRIGARRRGQVRKRLPTLNSQLASDD